MKTKSCFALISALILIKVTSFDGMQEGWSNSCVIPESVCEGFLLKNILWYSSANHHHLIIIIVISSSSSSHHHLIIIIFSSSSHHHHHHLSPLSLLLFFSFLFFSNLAQPSTVVTKNVPGATPLRESACRVSKTDGFLRFLRFLNF